MKCRDSPVSRPRVQTNRAGKDPVGGGIEDLCTVDEAEDRKDQGAWLPRHVRYAQLECERRGSIGSLPERQRARYGDSSRPLARSILKESVLTGVPAKPAALFVYMYIARLGFPDGVGEASSSASTRRVAR